MLDLQFYLNITLTNNCITWITPWIEKPTTSFLLCIYIFLFTAQGSGLSQLWPIQVEQPCHCPSAGQNGQSLQEWPPWFLGPMYFISIHSTGSTDSVLGEQCLALRHPGLGTRHSHTHLVSLWGRTGLHSWVRPALCPQPQLPCQALERPTPPRPPRLHSQQPQAQDGRGRPSTNEASWFVFLSKWIN